jgi:predicted DNA binding CopG/RHH family protein
MKKKSSIKKAKSQTTKKNLETRFNQRKSVLDYFDTTHAIKRINLDIPEWVIQSLDQESSRRGIARQALIKIWLVEKLDALKKAG